MGALEVGLVLTLVGATIVAFMVMAFRPRAGRTDGLVEPRLRRVMASEFDLDPDRLTLGASLRGDLGLHAADVVTLAPALEDELSIIMPERFLRRAGTFGDLVRAAVVLLAEGEL
jgi:acyl carrier protein